MTGRGDNNKAGSLEQFTGNRTNQGFSLTTRAGKSNHCGQGGIRPDFPEVIRKDPSSYRNTTQQKEINIDRLTIKQSDSSPVDSFVCK